MGFWDYINTVKDRLKRITPDLSTVKHAAYNHTSAAVTKIDHVVSNQKLPEYLPDPETRAQIGVFATTLAKNTGKYIVNEGFKHIPGVNVAHKLIVDTMRELKQKNQGDGMKEMEEKVESLDNKDSETRAQIGVSTTTLAKKTLKSRL
ncbi:uncharacterized protein [Rutidosis leptorrhynchoides]|uniref:uncharacterized protein n=1 Tax=Rutidosis leptorrhynchoides TaxID=125765 RepID=UPI003A99888C